MKKKAWVLGEYIGHLTIGAAMFAALLVFGGALKLLVHWATPIVGDSSFTDLMLLVESVILYADVVFVLWWTVYSTYRALKELNRD